MCVCVYVCMYVYMYVYTMVLPLFPEIAYTKDVCKHVLRNNIFETCSYKLMIIKIKMIILVLCYFPQNRDTRK